MNSAAIRYKMELVRALPCGFLWRKKLLGQFGDSLSGFCAEHPQPSYEQLTAAFGPPEEMAAVLMETVPDRELTKHAVRRKLHRIFGCIVLVLFIAFSVYVFYFKEVTVITSYDTAAPASITSTQGRN